MKRTLLLAALVAASASAFAADPQPSFQDSAPIQGPSVGSTTIVKGDLPKPSFNDNADVTFERSIPSRPATTATTAPFPTPSFAG